jgi:16S rRNA (adenine1518-N6/adenine1519-N6)-dimethyltransferase
MKLSEMKQILTGRNIRLSKSLGQNFLHDGNQLRRIVAAGELKPSDQVLEIGPGLGPLTDLLLAQAGNVLAVEKDCRLVDALLDSMAAGGGLARGVRPKLRLVHDDALKFLRRESRDWSDWKMVSNLPYSSASPILVELAQATGCPERMVVTVQREVAQRIIANPGDEDYGLLTLLIQLRYEPHGWFKVSAGCFFPRPDVDSACVTLLRRSKPLLNREQAATFTKIVKRAFSQRRKMMLKLLKEDWSQDWLSRWFKAGGLTTEVRAEQLGLNEFVRLAELLHANQNSCHG